MSIAAPFRLPLPILRMKLGNVDPGRTRLHARRVVAVVATARCGNGGGRIEQGGDVGELARKLFVRKTVRRDIAGLLHGHTRSLLP